MLVGGELWSGNKARGQLRKRGGIEDRMKLYQWWVDDLLYSSHLSALASSVLTRHRYPQELCAKHVDRESEDESRRSKRLETHSSSGDAGKRRSHGGSVWLNATQSLA